MTIIAVMMIKEMIMMNNMLLVIYIFARYFSGTHASEYTPLSSI